MEFMTVKSVSENIYSECKIATISKVEENLLFQELYTCFCRIENIENKETHFVELMKNEYASCDLCNKLSEWYDTRYRKIFGMIYGGKGQKRSVTRKHTFNDGKSFIVKNKGRKKGEFKKVGMESLYGVYNFDRLYSQNQFKKYLLDGKLESSQYTYEFILHTAVAFFMKPNKLNKLLNYYGFQGLHVKNIHHLAVYSVLKEVEMNPSIARRGDFNPFEEVREIYQDMRMIMNEDETCFSGEDKRGMVLTNTLTTVLQSNLMGEGNLTRDKLLRIVESNRKVFNMMHSKILRDHRRFSIALSCIYGNSEFEEEKKYSLYSFVKEFGNGIPTQKRLWENLHRHILLEEKHPTRELMIIFWLYAYCFFYEGEIWISSNTRKAMERKSRNWPENKKQNEGDENKKSDKMVDDGYFDLYAFLTEETSELNKFFHLEKRKVARSKISGANCIAAINEKLQGYGWGTLNKRRKFDFFIMQLANLMIEDEGGTNKRVFYKKKELEPILPVDNVPYLLVVIVELLRALTTEANSHINPEDQEKHFILGCRLYEQI